MQEFEDFRAWVGAANGKRMWVAGRLSLHRLVHGEQETGRSPSLVPALRVRGQHDVPGGSACLARMLNGAGAEVTITGIIGDDEAGGTLLAHLDGEGINTEGVVISEVIRTETRTVIEPVDEPERCVCELIRLSEVDTSAVRPSLERMLLETLEEAAEEADAIAIVETPDTYLKAYTAAARELYALGGPPLNIVPDEHVQRYGSRGPTETKLLDMAELRWMAQQARDNGRKVAFTNGCFDILHAGHVEYLRSASEHGDIFVIALNSDESVRRLKGAGRPVVPEDQRAAVLSGLGCVDAITLFSTDDVQPLLSDLQPEVYVKGGDYTIDTINQDERALVESYGGRIVLIPGREGASTTNILARIREENRE